MSGSPDPIVIVPAAGRGQRFREAGFDEIKPLIRFTFDPGRRRMSMLFHAIYGTEGWRKIIGVPLGTVLPSSLDMTYGNFYGVAPNGGQADTVVELLRYFTLEDKGPVLVLNCDTSFRGTVLRDFCHACWTTGMKAGAVVVHRDDGSSYSFVDNAPIFHRAAERVRLSPWAIAGATWFRNTEILLDALGDALDSGVTHNGERYLSTALGLVPGPKLAFPIREELFMEFGTPEKLREITG